MKRFIVSLVLTVLPLLASAQSSFPRDGIWAVYPLNTVPRVLIIQDEDETAVLKGQIIKEMPYHFWLSRIVPLNYEPYLIHQVRVDGKVILDCKIAPAHTCFILVSKKEQMAAYQIGLTSAQVESIRTGKQLEFVTAAESDAQHVLIYTVPLKGFNEVFQQIEHLPDSHLVPMPKKPEHKGILTTV